MTEMRILTVRQPWAWAIIHGGKDVENRTRNLAGEYRGPVAIHAAKALADFSVTEVPPLADVLHPLLNAVSPVARSWWADRGAIIGVVDLVDVHDPLDRLFLPTVDVDGVCSSWAEHGAFHLVLANPRPLSEPIPYKGALGLLRLPDDVVAQVLASTGEDTTP